MEIVAVKIVIQEVMRELICLSILPLLERCCCGSLGIFGVLALRVGCLYATGALPCRGSVVVPCPLELSLSDPDLDDKEFLLLADDNDDEEYEDQDDDNEEDDEAAADPPLKVCFEGRLSC